MIFGTRKTRVALGQFTSEECTSCKKNKEYIFYRVTKFIVIFFINLIPIGSSYECDCTSCDDTLGIDKAAGAKIAKTKFGEETSNQNFIVFLKLFVAAIVIAAAIALPLIFVRPQTSPQILKNLVDQDGQYTIIDRNTELVGVVSVVNGESQLIVYDDISRYKSPQGDFFTLHKRFEEVMTTDGSFLSPIADDFGSLIDENDINVQRYYYDIANNSYGFFVGVKDLSTIERTKGKTVYPMNVYNSDTDIIDYKLIVFDDAQRGMNVRYVSFEDGLEELIDIRVVEKTNGLITSETLYSQTMDSTQINFIGAVNSGSDAQAFYEFIMNNSLTVEYVEKYTYYKNTQVISNIETTVYDSEGNMSVSTVNYEIAERDGYYILKEVVGQP